MKYFHNFRLHAYIVGSVLLAGSVTATLPAFAGNVFSKSAKVRPAGIQVGAPLPPNAAQAAAIANQMAAAQAAAIARQRAAAQNAAAIRAAGPRPN